MKKYQAWKELKSCSDFRFSMEQMEIEMADDEEERYYFNPCHEHMMIIFMYYTPPRNLSCQPTAF